MNRSLANLRPRRLRRMAGLVVALAATGLVVPHSTVREAPTSLVRVETAQAIDFDPTALWVLFLGSDARPGEPVLRSRADAVQLVGVNTRTGAATAIGIPRDSYVEVPGHGQNKINISMTFGGPQLMARAVSDLVRIRPDYVFTTGFVGFRALIKDIGGITVNSKFAFTDAVMPGGYQTGRNVLNDHQALIFSRIRKSLPRGDFDRSSNQQATLLGILNRVRTNADEPGFMENGVLSVIKNLDTNLSPAELFRLAEAVTAISPTQLRACVIDGRIGYVGAASVVFPDQAQARSIGNRARRDATLEGAC